MTSSNRFDVSAKIPVKAIDDLYEELSDSQVNLGEKKVYPKRMPGRWRRIKWWSSTVWLVFFLGPYLRWGDRQAVLWDLPEQKFHIFGITILPQDLWLLAFVLLFFAILLAVVTAVAGRVFCGYFCFQTVWTDIYVAIENWLEGSPTQRKKLDQQPWRFNATSWRKIRIKACKHSLWLLIALLTGISFVAWFMDAYELWSGFLQLQLPLPAWTCIGAFLLGTYTLAGFMREQTCFWLCPYARIQGVMVDENTLVPAYDATRGEPRGHMKRSANPSTERRSDKGAAVGDCIDCYQCVAVCPTGIDIRQGLQQGCITCGLCIDACDAVMDKIGRPRGLVRYESLQGLRGRSEPRWYWRPRVWGYLGILLVALGSVGYGLSQLHALELNVLHHRQPLFVLQSDGSIQNRYRLKILNKTDQVQQLRLSLSGQAVAQLVDGGGILTAQPSGVIRQDVQVRIPVQALTQESTPLVFYIQAIDDPELKSKRESVFIAPVEVAANAER